MGGLLYATKITVGNYKVQLSFLGVSSLFNIWVPTMVWVGSSSLTGSDWSKDPIVHPSLMGVPSNTLQHVLGAFSYCCA